MKISGSICSSSVLSTSAQTNSKCKTGKDESEKDKKTVVNLKKKARKTGADSVLGLWLVYLFAKEFPKLISVLATRL